MTQTPAKARSAAFFDVDGTLVDATIAHYLRYFNIKRLPRWKGRLWYAAFLVRCLFYMALDRIDRARLNIIFYRNYAGLPSAQIKQMVHDCNREVIEPRRYRTADPTMREHQSAGRPIVLVTGSLDFIMKPFADAVQANSILASALVESNGTFTGELIGPPLGGAEKAKRIRKFAAENNIDLAASYAYGDSIADLPMLETVGFPHAVNPDKSLRKLAAKRNWPILHWN